MSTIGGGRRLTTEILEVCYNQMKLKISYLLQEEMSRCSKFKKMQPRKEDMLITSIQSHCIEIIVEQIEICIHIERAQTACQS